MTVSAATGQVAAAPEQGDFVFARGKSWIVERAEKAGPVQTLHLVSCEDDSQGEAIQLAFATELQTQVLDPNDWSPLLTKTFEAPQRLGAYLRSMGMAQRQHHLGRSERRRPVQVAERHCIGQRRPAGRGHKLVTKPPSSRVKRAFD
jgi:hypothetical protein